MPEDATATAEYVAELRKRREAYSEEALARLREVFHRRDRKPPEVFHDSSFLYIRSFDGDIGIRPFSGIVHWHSPDLLVSPITSVGAYTTTLQAGDTYVIRTVLRNRGDLAVPSAKVELFLTDPTLGFDTRFATRLTGLGNVPSAWVTSGGSAAAEFAYTVPPTEAGHKCLFARCFSFSPLELPIDDFALDPRLDRHVAQQNLNIVGQAQAFAFNLVHRPNARIRIALRPLQPEELLALAPSGPRGRKARAGVSATRLGSPYRHQADRDGWRRDRRRRGARGRRLLLGRPGRLRPRHASASWEVRSVRSSMQCRPERPNFPSTATFLQSSGR